MGRLANTLPLKQLKALSHKAHLTEIRDGHPAYLNKFQSKLIIVCGRDSAALQLLAQYENELATYSVTSAEVTVELPANSESHAVTSVPKVAGVLLHKRQRRPHFYAKHSSSEPKPGKFFCSTIYLEDKRSSVVPKVYPRSRKENGEAFSDPIISVEWTLSRSAVKYYMGANTIAALLDFDLVAFAEKRLVAGILNPEELGRLFVRDRSATTKKLKRAAYHYLRILTYDQWEHFDDHQLAKTICTRSPSLIMKSLRKHGFSQYEAEKCFSRGSFLDSSVY